MKQIELTFKVRAKVISYFGETPRTMSVPIDEQSIESLNNQLLLWINQRLGTSVIRTPKVAFEIVEVNKA